MRPYTMYCADISELLHSYRLSIYLKLYIELRVDRDIVLPAVRFIVVHEPPHIGRHDEFGILVIEFVRALHPAEQLRAIRMIGDQGVRFAGYFVDEGARRRDPIIFEIARAAFEAHHHDRAAMLVRADDARALHPQNVRIDVVAHVEGEMLDRRILAERHPGAVGLFGTDELSLGAAGIDQRLEQ